MKRIQKELKNFENNLQKRISMYTYSQYNNIRKRI